MSNVKYYSAPALVAAILLVTISCQRQDSKSATEEGENGLIGQWRATVQFSSGAFSTTKDLEFMFVFNDGGTLLESSNYDAAPPVPPAYGIWRQLAQNKYEARYEYFSTRAPLPSEGQFQNSGWLPAGRGVFTDTITLAQNGATFISNMHFVMYDHAGRMIEGGGDAYGAGVKLGY